MTVTGNVKFDFDPNAHSPALNPNGAKDYAYPMVDMISHDGERKKVRYDNAQDLKRFGTICKDGVTRPWREVKPAKSVSTEGEEQSDEVVAATAANATLPETKLPKLEGLRTAAGLLGIAVDHRWGVAKLEAMIKEKAVAMSATAPAGDLQLPPNGDEAGDAE